MIALRAQAYYVPGLPKYLRIISPQGIRTSEGYKGTFKGHCHDDQDGYTELNLKEDKPGWQKAEPVERVYIKYDPNNNLPTHEATLPNRRSKEADSVQDSYAEQEFWMTRLDWVGIWLNQFEMFGEHEPLIAL